MAKKRVIRCLIIILTIVLAAGVEMFWLSRRKTIKQYKETITKINDENINDIIKRIILDEEYHIQLLLGLYKKYVEQ